MNSEQITHQDTFLLGRTRGYNPRLLEHVSAEVSLGQLIGTYPTIEHDTITDPITFAVQFTVGPRPRGDYVDWDELVTRGGQTAPEDRKILRPPWYDKFKPGERNGYDLRHVIDTLWREWHLNATTPGCAHQVVPPEARDADHTGPFADSIKRCPITGYRWGSQWLIKPLTDAALERIASLNLTELTTKTA